MSDHRILQIMPADGWYAQYRWDEDDYGTETRIIAWALVEWKFKGETFQTVEGIENEDGASKLCTEYEGHRGYIYRDSPKINK